LNVGTGKSVTIDSLLKDLSVIINVQPEVIKAKLPIGDPEKSAGIYNKLNEILKININEFTSLEKGLRETINFTENSTYKPLNH
jgi:capsular polysaccharide biosynthesis protein